MGIVNIVGCPGLRYTRHDNGDRTAPRTKDSNNDGWGSCGIWVALHDLPEAENGCLLVAVDSHLNGTLPGQDYSSDRVRACSLLPLVVPLCAMRGSCPLCAHNRLMVSSVGGVQGTDKQLKDDSPVRSGEVLPIRMRQGDICVFSRATVHGSLPNTSNQVRVGYGLQYCRTDVNWLDRSTGQWRPLAAGDSPFQASVMPVEKLGPQKKA